MELESGDIMKELYKLYKEGKLQTNPQQQEFMGMNPQQQQFMGMNPQQQQFMGMGHYFPFGFGNNKQDENINVTFENEENLQRINIIIPKS